MGKSGKLFKSLVAGVKVFKSPSKERPVKEKSTPHANRKEDKDYVKKKSKDKCFGSLGKSSSRNRDVAAATSFPDAIEIKCVQVESEKLKDVLPIAESYSSETCVESKGMKVRGAANNGSACNQLLPTNLKEVNSVSGQEEWAASKIQAAFRCYLAQRAFRALKALVRLQALVRGRSVRKQASTSFQCINAVIRIQALARGHRVRNSELGQLVQKHLQQTKQSRKKPAEGWVNSLATAQQLHAKAQSKQDAVTKRQRALVYAFSEQLNRRTQKQSSPSGVENHVDKSHWIWVWLERWTDAAPKGSAIAAASVEERSSVTKTIEKPKSTTKMGKPSESSRKEGRKLNEHSDGTAPPSQRGLFAEEKERAPNVVLKKEEKAKATAESEKPGARKPSGSGSNSTVSATTVAPKPLSSPPPLTTPPLSSLEDSFKEEASTEISLPATQLPSSSAVPAVMHPTSPVCAYESKVATPSSPSDTSLQPAACDVLLAEAMITTSLGANSTSSSTATQQVLSLNTLSSPNGPSKQQACATTETLLTGSESPARKSMSNSLSVFSFSPPEECSPTESLPSTYPLKEHFTLTPETHPHSEQGMFSIDHASLPPPSCTPDLAHESLSNGMLMPEDGTHLANGDNGNGIYVPEDIIMHMAIGDNELHALEETISQTNGDYGVHMPEAGMKEDATRVLSEEAASATNEDMDYKNEDSIQIDALSETTGRCDASVVSVGAQSVEISSKHTTGPGSKHEQHTECVSPSVPSYMATTKSSKAKVRTLTSPKQKSESPKQKLESPKPKLDSPKPKVDSPTPKLDSATKRRHSLSALDGKVSPGTNKPVVHVRASSKGQLSSLKDLSTDNLVLPNGNSRRHGK